MSVHKKLNSWILGKNKQSDEEETGLLACDRTWVFFFLFCAADYFPLLFKELSGLVIALYVS